MVSKIHSFGLIGIEGYKVDIEIDIKGGLPGYEIAGLADTAIKESKQRVHSAIKNSGYNYTTLKVIINLAPANTKKEGSLYDLGIALGILNCSEQIKSKTIKDYVIIGELSLDGNVRKVNGILPIIISAREKGYKNILIPKANSVEAGFIEGMNIIGVDNLHEAVQFFNGTLEIKPVEINNFENIKEQTYVTNDFSQVKGQYAAKRALEIAAAGGHNVIMMGPPGSGKTMLARAFPGILPSMTFEEALEVTKIHSVAGILDSKQGIVVNRPFRSPHHTATIPALAGGGRNSKPGEISLAHNGVLFLDEMPEYKRDAIEALRQPLEDGVISVSRLNQSVDYPANIILIASMNPCPCGYYGSQKVQCKCTPTQIHKYLHKLSGPLMDRIDLHIEVENVEYNDINSTKEEETSETIRERVNNARKIQLKRFFGTSVSSNSNMNNKQINQYCKLNEESRKVLEIAFEKFKMTARAYTRVLKVARTIADLDNKQNIEIEHLLEAIQYRALDNKYWV